MSLALRVALAVVLLALPVAADDTSPTTTVPSPPPSFQTTVRGTVPDLTGRWLAVAWLEVPGNEIRTAAYLWDVTRRDGQLDVRMPYVQLPTKQNTVLQGSSEHNEPWKPSAQDLTEIATAWDELEPLKSHPIRLENYITGRDAFDATFTAEARTKDAQWVLQQTENFDASAAPAVRQVSVFATLGEADGGYHGNFTTTLLAVAPFPIPINFNGTFQLYRLTASSPGILTRIADLFRGCGK